MSTLHPVPEHGSEARYKGTRSGSRPPCRCNRCIRGNRLAGIRRERVRLAGQSNLIPVPVLAAHIKVLQDSGLSQCAIARAAQVAQSTISNISNGKLRSCQRSKGERILAVQAGIHDATSERSVLGSARRLQALYAIGHGALAISKRFDINHSTISQIVNGRYRLINGSVAVRVQGIYDQLSRTPGPSKKARARAAACAWAPPAAWDDEALDDPAAAPEWTGFCGTDRGWWTHSIQRIPGCARCDAAHEAWKAEHRVLERSEYQAALMKSRASASSRGIAIAEDGRELLRLGHTHETAAARLGVTQQHLYQEFTRHPALVQAA
ncbi:hypothetical protein [Streptomyces sp. NBC_01022]|uniref:hypothetical protein n=1 Tax=Streptomyces sp. NBC_01022 TaxID=2903723 RepID=UPI002DD7EDF0|nr:hypothetical protein [Streptomyces sp. NBC_01022]WRZ84809.1 hypothetical protein OG316_33395 [Streptomyces sp. NBC_01022]